MAVILSLGTAGLVSAADAVKTPLVSRPLPDHCMVLARSSYNESRSARPILYYRTEDIELILPNASWVLTQKTPRQKLTIRGVSCEIAYRDGGLAVSAAGESQKLVDSGLGCQSVAIPLGDGMAYVLAFPRGYFYEGEGHLFCRSGSMQTATVDGVEVRLYDDDLDGRYVKGKDGLSIGDDGGMCIFGTLSDLLPTTKAVYEVRAVAEDGSAMTLNPYVGPTGRLKIEPIEGLACRLAFASQDGKCSFGMLADEQGLTLPADKYHFLYGYVYRSSTKNVVALVLPSKGLTVNVEQGRDTTLTLGDLAEREFPWGEGPVTLRFKRLLEVDLTGVEEAFVVGDFVKGQKLFDEISGKYPAGPNYEVSKVWMEDLRRRLAFETSPEGTALREAETKLLAAVNDDKRDTAKALLPTVQEALKKIPAQFTQGWPYRVHKTRVAAMSRYAAGTATPGLKMPEVNFRLQDRDRATAGYSVSAVPGGEYKVAQTVDWETQKDWPYAKAAQYHRHGWLYDGFLVVPQQGEYELTLESGTGGARLYIDDRLVIDHWGAHVPEERAVRLTLTEGRHPLKIKMYTLGGTHRLRFWWTPPGGRGAIVPAWALEYSEEQVEQPKP